MGCILYRWDKGWEFIHQCNNDPAKHKPSLYLHPLSALSSQWVHNWFLSLRRESWLAWDSLPCCRQSKTCHQRDYDLYSVKKTHDESCDPRCPSSLPSSHFVRVGPGAYYIEYWQYGDKKSWHGLFQSFCRWNILAASLSSWRIDALSPLLRLRSPDTSSAPPTRSFMYVSPSEKISDKKARYRPSVSRTDSRPGTSSPCLCSLTSAPQSAGEKLLAGSTTVPTMAEGEKRKHKINKIHLW